MRLRYEAIAKSVGEDMGWESSDAGIMASQQTGLTVTVDAGGRREVEIVINTDDEDQDSEVVVPSGADMTYYEKTGKKVFADHSYSVTDVAGHTRTLRSYGVPGNTCKGWIARACLGNNPIGDAVKAIIDDSGSIGASVGFVARDRSTPTADEMKRYCANGKSLRSIVREWKMLEWSFTAMPCNGAAMGGWADEEGGKRYNQIDQLICKGKVSRVAASLLGFPDQRKTVIVPKPSIVLPKPVVKLKG